MKLNKLFLAAALLVTGSLVSCGGGDAPAAAKKMSVGVGYSHAFEEKYGSYQLDLTGAFAAFDEDGKVVDARFDVVQVKAKANDAKDGLVLTNKNLDASHSVTSKLELGDDYGMVGASGIGKEVDYQIEAFADWTVGKTIAEVKAGVAEGSGHGVTPNEELKTSVTITVTDFVAALESAFANKTGATYEVTEGAKAGIGMVSGLSYSNPTTEYDVVIGGSYVKDGKVIASAMDQVVFPTTISAEGVVAGDTTSKYFKDGVLKSKYTLKEGYAMKPVSEKEWFEHADIISAATVGKTADEIKAMKKGEGDLTGATITVDSYLAALAKAVNYAPLARVAAGK